MCRFHEISGDPGASEDSICLSYHPWNCCHLYIWQKNSAESLWACLMHVCSVSPVARYLLQRISQTRHCRLCGKLNLICRDFMSTVFRIVGPCSAWQQQLQKVSSTTEQPAEGGMTCTLTTGSWTVPQYWTEACRRRCGSQILDSTPPRRTFKSSTQPNRAGHAGIFGWQWRRGSGGLYCLLKRRVQA